MKKLILTVLFVMFSIITYSQDIIYKVSDFNGIYETQDKNGYLIFRDGVNISPYFYSDGSIDTIELSYYGFCNDTIKYSRHLKIRKSDIKSETGVGYKLLVKGELINGKIDILDAMTYEYDYSPESQVLILFGPKDLFYYKKDRLSPKREKLLRQECKKKNIDVDYFLSQSPTMVKISIPKSTLYKTPNVATKMYLIKGNEVEILEQKGNWLKIRYYGKKTIEGWIKKEEVE